MWERRRRLVRPEWDPTHNVWRAAADTLRSSPEGTAALAAPHHCSPRIAAFRFFRSQRTRRRIPRVRFFRNQITSCSRLGPRVGSARGRANRTPPPRGLRPRMLPLHHAPPIFQGAEHESLRPQYAGKPATGCLGLLFVAMQVMVAGTQGLRVFQHADLGSAVAKPGGSTPRCFGISSASASPAARSARSSADATPGVRISAGKGYVYVI